MLLFQESLDLFIVRFVMMLSIRYIIGILYVLPYKIREVNVKYLLMVRLFVFLVKLLSSLTLFGTQIELIVSKQVESHA